ncbi:ABC transporter substrate-binding protein [Niveispirillum sp.]|uniref:ABC transporter substrate-binding protein n=1 Tax=Niveispirillum sp. TaxID=1917217 RepID=UPI001B79C5A0|nr:extracellular solute-binding protein [Niveispirillum sp.]MBP7339384.1 extracellular solute-binding protein [Niveispirillum sp.]
MVGNRTGPSRRALLTGGLATGALATLPRPGRASSAGPRISVMVVAASQFRGLELRTPEFTRATGIAVDYLTTPFRNLQQKVSAVGVAHDGGVDIVTYMDAWGPSNAYWYEDLTPLMARDGLGLDRYPAAFHPACRSGGRITGLPVRGAAQTFYYRRDLFDRHGLSAPATWTDVIDAGRRLATLEPSIAPLNLYFGNDGSQQNLFVWLSLIWSAGGDLFAANGAPLLTSAVVADATRFYIDLHRRYAIANRGSVSFVEKDAAISFAQGKAAMAPLWSWNIGQFMDRSRSVLTPDQVGFVPMPAVVADRPSVAYANVFPMSINRYSGQKEAAWAYLKWLSDPALERRNALEKQVAGQVLDNNIVVQRSNLSDPTISAANGGTLALAANALETGRVCPQMEDWPEIGETLSNMITRAANGQDIDRLLARAQRDVIATLRRGGLDIDG